jgi:outer membrane protein OmpA-like peptidoglycan-associated protein
MRLQATRILFGYSLLLPALLLAPSVAHAQPADDPGLGEPAPPPPPLPPAPTPIAPAPRPTAPTAPTAPAAPATPTPPPRAMPAPSNAPPPPPEVNETVDTQVTWIDEKEKTPATVEGDLYERVAAPTLMGPVGLFRTLTGDSGRQNNFRVGLHIGLFQDDSFLVRGNSTTPGDTNSRFTGDLTIGYTPWKYLELYLGLFNASNKNERRDAGRTDPQVILSLGDLALGVKGRYPVAPWFDLALHLGVKFLNSVSGISFDGDSTNFAVDAIGSFDLRHAAATKYVPLRFHLNFGYLLDNSMNLLPAGQCALSTGNDPCIRSRVVETFAYGIGSSRLRIALAADAPITIRSVGLEPFVEYHAEIAVDDGDQTVLRALRNDPAISSDRLTNQALQYMTFGVRVRPVVGLILDAGIDVGLQSPGFQYGPPVPPWNVILGAAYAYDPAPNTARKTKMVTKTVTREISRAPAEGRVRGVVRDAKTRKPIGGALVRYLNRGLNPQASADDGTFLSYGLGPGLQTLEVAREDYEPMRVEAMIAARAETPVEVLLTPKPPAAGQVRSRVSDSGGLPVAATVRFTSSSGAIVDADVEGQGTFNAKLPGGEYTMDIVAGGYLSKQRQVSVQAAQVQTVDVVLTKKPLTSHVTLTKNEITTKIAVHFGTNNATLAPDGEQLLDEVADVMVRNPQIKRVRIEGHTDNRGLPQKNLELSKARAAAVVAYLVKQGIDPARLESEGYGATQPLVPNLTPANRAKNRRVTFRILDQGTSGLFQ